MDVGGQEGRPRRQRMRPLEFWANERVVYGVDGRDVIVQDVITRDKPKSGAASSAGGGGGGSRMTAATDDAPPRLAASNAARPSEAMWRPQNSAPQAATASQRVGVKPSTMDAPLRSDSDRWPPTAGGPKPDHATPKAAVSVQRTGHHPNDEQSAVASTPAPSKGASIKRPALPSGSGHHQGERKPQLPPNPAAQTSPASVTKRQRRKPGEFWATTHAQYEGHGPACCCGVCWVAAEAAAVVGARAAAEAVSSSGEEEDEEDEEEEETEAKPPPRPPPKRAPPRPQQRPPAPPAPPQKLGKKQIVDRPQAGQPEEEEEEDDDDDDDEQQQQRWRQQQRQQQKQEKQKQKQRRQAEEAAEGAEEGVKGGWPAWEQQDGTGQASSASACKMAAAEPPFEDPAPASYRGEALLKPTSPAATATTADRLAGSVASPSTEACGSSEAQAEAAGVEVLACRRWGRFWQYLVRDPATALEPTWVAGSEVPQASLEAFLERAA